MKKLYIILPIMILIPICGNIGYRYYEKNKEFERTMIEANNAIKSKEYQEVLNILMYAKSLKNGDEEIKKLEEEANLGVKNSEKIEKAKTLFEKNKHEQAIDILKNIEDEEAKKLLLNIEREYNEKLIAEENIKQEKIFEENFSRLPQEEIKKTRETIDKNLNNAIIKYIKNFRLNIEDIDYITTPYIYTYNINEFYKESRFELSPCVTQLSYILDKKWSDVGNLGTNKLKDDDKNFSVNINYDDTVRNTINILIDNIYDAKKEKIEENNSIIDCNLLFTLEISKNDNSTENVKTLIKSIRKGVDELVDQEIKRLQEIANQSNMTLDYDKLKYKLHPGTYNDIFINFSKDRMEDNKAMIGITFLSSKTNSKAKRYNFFINSKEVVDILKTVQVNSY